MGARCSDLLAGPNPNSPSSRRAVPSTRSLVEYENMGWVRSLDNLSSELDGPIEWMGRRVNGSESTQKTTFSELTVTQICLFQRKERRATLQ